MAKLVAHMRLIAGALALAFIVAISAPVSAQQPSMVNPTAERREGAAAAAAAQVRSRAAAPFRT